MLIGEFSSRVGATLKLATAALRIVFISAALLSGIAAAASGQQGQPIPLPPEIPQFPQILDSPDALSADYMPDPSEGLISLDISVTDPDGKPVSGLGEKDFTLLDNNRPQNIVTFRAMDGTIAQPANSLEIVLMIDELNLLPGEAGVAGLHRDVETFLRANGGALAKPTIIYRLTKEGLFVTLHPTMNGNALAGDLEQPALQRQIWSPSTIAKAIRIDVKPNGADHDAVTKAVRPAREIDNSLIALGSIAIEERRRPGKKIMFWLGNGWPMERGVAAGLSDFSIELLTRMREAHIQLWSALESYDVTGIATTARTASALLASDMQSELAQNVAKELATNLNRELAEAPKLDLSDLRYLSLPVLAIRSGGGIVDPGHPLAASLQKRIAEEGTFYRVTFDPPRTNVLDEYHHLHVEFNSPGPRSHVFEDYYDQPVFYDQLPAAQSVSVKQLQAMMAREHGLSDGELARQLDHVRLTERLNTAKLETIEKSVRGKKARAALAVLADRSAFFAPPDDEIIAAPPPQKSAQQEMIGRAVSYIDSTIPHLPDFLATRTSVQYFEVPPKPDQTWKTAPADQSLHEGEISKASIRFRQGKELVKDESVKVTQGRSENQGTFGLLPLSPGLRQPSNPNRQHLKTIGAFGPILGTVMIALTSPHSQILWDHWEQSNDGGRLAVFRYHLTQETPFFSAGFCCLPVENKTVPFIKKVPFHGVIAIDPETGAIIRLTVQSDLGWRLPLKRSDLMVEYRPVAAGSKRFFCPSKAVSISRQRGVTTIHEWGEVFEVYAAFETVLNEMRFDNYHIFGSTSRILPGYVEAPEN